MASPGPDRPEENLRQRWSVTHFNRRPHDLRGVLSRGSPRRASRARRGGPRSSTTAPRAREPRVRLLRERSRPVADPTRPASAPRDPASQGQPRREADRGADRVPGARPRAVPRRERPRAALRARRGRPSRRAATTPASTRGFHHPERRSIVIGLRRTRDVPRRRDGLVRVHMPRGVRVGRRHAVVQAHRDQPGVPRRHRGRARARRRAQTGRR